MKNQDILETFEFVVQEVHRLNLLRRTDWKKAAEEGGLHRLPLSYDDFPKNHVECGSAAARRLYGIARAKLRELADLNGRVKVETFLRPIEIEFGNRALVKGEKVTEVMVKEIIRAAKTWAKTKLEDRTYFFPVYVIDEQEAEEFEFGAARFLRTQRFLLANESKFKESEDEAVKTRPAIADNADEFRTHISELFTLAKEHYSDFRWIACVEILNAEPELGLKRAREVLEQSLNLLRLSVPSSRGQFIGLAEDYPTLRSASYLSLRATGEFDTWHTASYAEPHCVRGFVQGFRHKVRSIECAEQAIERFRLWTEPQAIEDRLLTALFWFGEAWKETGLLPKIVKFCTSVESLLSTPSDHDAITEKISERLAWLSFPESHDWQKRRETYAAMKQVYGVRSKAVHGDSAVKEVDLPAVANLAEEQACLAIFAFLQLPPLFQKQGDPEKCLNEFFVRLKLEGLERAKQLLLGESVAAVEHV
jgi:hypothetical protein